MILDVTHLSSVAPMHPRADLWGSLQKSTMQPRGMAPHPYCINQSFVWRETCLCYDISNLPLLYVQETFQASPMVR